MLAYAETGLVPFVRLLPNVITCGTSAIDEEI